MSKTDLLPCPFCGSEAKLIVYDESRAEAPLAYVLCTGDERCWGNTTGDYTDEDAIAAWNARSLNDDAVKGERERILAAIEAKTVIGKSFFTDGYNQALNEIAAIVREK